MGAAPTGTSLGTQALMAVATAPALRPVADVDGPAGSNRAASARPDEGQVLGRRSASGSSDTGGDAAPPRQVTAQLAAPGEEGFSPVPLLALLVLLAAASLLVIRRRDRAPEVAPAAAIAPQAPPEPEPAPIAPSRPPAAPVVTRPPPAAPPAPEHPSGEHGARRAAGLAASGLVSVAIGLLVRARRRR